MTAYFFWDPSPEIFPFKLPLLDRPILWYGFFFALGFFAGYWVFVALLNKIPSLKNQAKQIADKTAFYLLIGTLVGSRLGDLLFYQSWQVIQRDPTVIFKIWEGGLASHGGAVGILVALFFLAKKLQRQFHTLSFLSLLDLVVIPTGLVAASIRVGNFFNQEILGKPTEVAWAVLFGHPVHNAAALPRHPVQLYEAFAYLALFLTTLLLWKKVPKMHQKGKMAGLFLTLLFLFRFFIEFFKEEQSLLIEGGALLSMGQWLSIPFILLGLFLLCRKNR